MPLPSPKGKEKRADFVSRCVSVLTKRKEGKDSKQRVAICNSQFKKAKASRLTDDEIEVLNFFRYGADHGGSSKKKKKKFKKKKSTNTY